MEFDINLIACGFSILILILMGLYAYLVFKFHKAYVKRFDVLYRLMIPALIFIVYQVFWLLIGWNFWAAITIMGLLANWFMFWKLWNEEGVFEYEIPNTVRCGLLSIYLYFYDDDMITDANVFKLKKYSTNFAAVNKIIEDNKIMNRTRDQFDSDDKWAQYEKIREAYERRRNDPANYRVDVLGFYHIMSGHKLLLLIHEGDLPDRIIEANAIKTNTKEVIAGHTFEKIICLGGQDSLETQRHMRANIDYLDVLSCLTLLESIPEKNTRIAKLEELNRKQRGTMEEMKDDIILAGEYNKYNQSIPASDQHLIKIVLVAVIVPTVLVALFIILSLIGVV